MHKLQLTTTLNIQKMKIERFNEMIKRVDSIDVTRNTDTVSFRRNEGTNKFRFYLSNNKVISSILVERSKCKKVHETNLKYAIDGLWGKIEAINEDRQRQVPTSEKITITIQHPADMWINNFNTVKNTALGFGHKLLPLYPILDAVISDTTTILVYKNDRKKRVYPPTEE